MLLQGLKPARNIVNIASGKTNVRPLSHTSLLWHLSLLLAICQHSAGDSRFYILLLVVCHPFMHLNVLSSWLVLGAAALEVAGRLVFSQGLATSLRPKKYYTIPREALEAALEDVEQLINFFVIEFQRILFVENLANTLAAFLAAFISYWLIKVVPLWGLSLISVSAVYLSPLIYINNKELIDQQLDNAYHIINSQAVQVRDLAAHHTSRATSTAKAYAGDYTSKAQEYIGSARGRSKSPELIKSSPQIKSEPGSEPKYSPSDFPHAPKQDLVPGVTSHQEQYEKSGFGGQAEPSY